MYQRVSPGQHIIIDHGRLAFKVKRVQEYRVTVESLNNYEMKGPLKMIMPRAKLNSPLISDKEMEALV